MYKIDKKVAQAILDYLARQPYTDVFELVQALQNLEEIKEDKKSGNKKDGSNNTKN